MSVRTPGPWKYAQAVAQNMPDYFAVVAPRIGRATFGGIPIANCWNEADARLIALTPAMLDCVQSVWNHAQNVCEMSGEDAREALIEIQQLSGAILHAAKAGA